MKCGLVIEGGARRCIYAAGVLDCFFQNQITFDYICGVSAGAQIAANYVSSQPNRSKQMIIPYSTKENRFSIRKVLSCDLNQLAYEYPYRQCPFQFQNYFQSDVVCEMVATNCETAAPTYFCEKENEKTLLDYLYASCCVPILYPEIEINGAHYVDGSIADAIPYERALQMGCDRVIVILAKSAEEAPTDYAKWKPILAKKYKNNYPQLYEMLLHRVEQYEQQRKKLLASVDNQKIMLFRPDQPYVKPFEKNQEKLEYAYQVGYNAAAERMDEICSFVGKVKKCYSNP